MKALYTCRAPAHASRGARDERGPDVHRDILGDAALACDAYQHARDPRDGERDVSTSSVRYSRVRGSIGLRMRTVRPLAH